MEYKEILDAVKGEANVKRLASQFIARFFKFFPTLADQGLDALFDLCEDTDVAVSFIFKHLQWNQRAPFLSFKIVQTKYEAKRQQF